MSWLVLLERGTGSMMDLCYLYLDFTNVLGVVDGETDIDTLFVETGSVFVVILFDTSSCETLCCCSVRHSETQ